MGKHDEPSTIALAKKARSCGIVETEREKGHYIPIIWSSRTPQRASLKWVMAIFVDLTLSQDL